MTVGDKKWQKEKNKYDGIPCDNANVDVRFRDWDNLKYWFRGVEKFAPWVNNIYFVTCGHYPKWLNLNHPKLKFVRHDEYIPSEYLPTFSSHTIELNLHRIKNLNEKFVYFNDDMFIINKVQEEDFFINDKPRFIAGCDTNYSEDYDDAFPHILLNDMSIINKYFDKRKVIRKNIFKWVNMKYDINTIAKTLSLMPFNRFSSMAISHIPIPVLKSTIEELWKKEEQILDKVSKNKFRTKDDVNQYLFSFYDIARNNFEPADKKLGKYYSIKDLDNIIETIRKQKYKMICFSDERNIDFEMTKKEINDSFEKILPTKSEFEIYA